MKRVKGKGKGTVKSSKEALKPVDDRKVGKRKTAIKPDKSVQQKAKKQRNAQKDPNKPKRPASAFFVFLEEFRKEYKKENPNVKGVSAVGKAGGQKWKSMSDDEKAPYEARAGKRKAEYEKLIKEYDKKQGSAVDDDEVNDDEDEEQHGNEDGDDSEEEEEDEDDD